MKWTLKLLMFSCYFCALSCFCLALCLPQVAQSLKGSSIYTVELAQSVDIVAQDIQKSKKPQKPVTKHVYGYND